MRRTGVVKAGLLLALYVMTTLLSACVVAEPREGYYDRPHHRWYHDHAWVVCAPGDIHCR